MNTEIRELVPKIIWNSFADLNAIPRPSKKEERVIEFMVNFGKDLGLVTIIDEIGNVIIRKPATPGMENRKGVILQSHLDMVHQKDNDTVFDFETQGIDMYIDGDWVRARGTTLGADNGLGVATIMAILQCKDIEHPELEALFTIDEETGMTGAMGLTKDALKGDILLNLDTEEDDEIGVGCAGGIDITANRSYTTEKVASAKTAYQIKVKGLQGGHSGMDIIKGLGNANKIMNRLMLDGFDNYGLRISKIDGGGLRNAIPRESNAIIVIDSIHEDAFCLELAQLSNSIQMEFENREPNLKIEVNKVELPETVMELGIQEGLIKALSAAQNGVYRMSADIDGLVETSNNIARVLVNDGKIKINCLTRSSLDSAKLDLANSIRSVFELIGCDVEFSGEYPGWKPNMDSEILKVVEELYVELNEEKPNVAACHAGLECGILGQNYPNIDMVSLGPDILGAHSPDERASIKSVRKFWNFLIEILKRIPNK